MQIDPKLRGTLPKADPATPLETADGRFRGRKVTLPGRHSPATPAIADGPVFPGGGFGRQRGRGMSGKGRRGAAGGSDRGGLA